MYKVLARKYRPSKLDEIVGQDVAVRILKNAIKSNRLHHAILLSGPMGTGKTSIARIIAKSLNCLNGPTIEPCNSCESCRAVSKGNNVDVYEIDGASNRKVDDARGIIESVKYPPLKSRFKIYIIDEVHMLTVEAFNALLKTIEEPPDYVKFIFATTAIEKVPDTILSRCQILYLKKISKHLIKEKLQKIAVSEGVDIEDEALDIISFASFGSLRVAEGYLDRCISYNPSKVSSEDASKVVGVTNRDTVIQYFKAVNSGNLSLALSIVDEQYSRDINFEIFLQQLIDYILGIKLSVEYKAGLLNIYYHTLIEVKQKLDSMIALNVATYKASSLRGLDRISSVIEKLLKNPLNIDVNEMNNGEYDGLQNQESVKDGNNITKETIIKKTNKESMQAENEDNFSDGVKKILKEFGGKIIAIEKTNK